MALYRATELTATPNKPSYVPGEYVSISVKGTVERHSVEGFTGAQNWHVDYIVVDSSDKSTIVKTVKHTHFFTYGREDSPPSDIFSFSADVINPGVFNYTLKVVAKDG